ncbi:MAG: GNAT family N-acetyltransferase [Planctomycetales bacterium]
MTEGLQVWQALDARLKMDSISSSWEWTAGWIKSFGSHIPHQIWIGEENGVVRGMSLVTFPVTQQGPFSVRSVHLGTAGEPQTDSLCVEYNRLLVEEPYRTNFMLAILEKLHEDSTWDQIHFDGMAPEEAEILIATERQLQVRLAPSPYFSLQQAREQGEGILKLLGSNSRNDIKRKLRQWGKLTIDWAETNSQAEEIYGELIQLHQQRWNAAGQPGSFSSSPFREFHRRMIHEFLPQRRVALIRVKNETQTIGCVLNYIERKTVLFYQIGVAAEPAKQSPGLISIYACMEEALRRGYDKFDFLAGDGEHKRRLSTHANQLIWGKYQRPRFKFSLIDNLRMARNIWTRQ